MDGSLPFAWAKLSVGLGERQAQFRIGKFHSGIVFNYWLFTSTKVSGKSGRKVNGT